MSKKNILAIFMLVAFGLSVFSILPVTASSGTPMNTRLSIPISSGFTPYSADYKIQDALLSGTTMNLGAMPNGFQLPQTSSTLDLSGITVQSDSALPSQPSFSRTFINNTYNAISKTSGLTEVTAIAAGAGDTVLTATVHGNGSAVNTGTYTSDLQYDANGNGLFTDAVDKSYLPLSSTVQYFLISANCNGDALSTADYCDTQLVFKTTGSDFTVHVEQLMGSGTSGWSYTTSSATLKYYSADNQWISTIVPLANIWSDSSTAVSLTGLDKINVAFSVNSSSNTVYTSHNIALFSKMPALTVSKDDNANFAYANSGTSPKVAVNPWDDTDYLQTKITGTTGTTYNNALPLLNDLSGSVTLQQTFRLLKFTGVAVINPSYSVQSQYISSGKYLTTETLTFDTTDVNNFVSFGNVITMGNIQLNVTIDKSILYDRINFDNNLVAFTIDGVSHVSTFKSAWGASTVTDLSDVQYDISDFSTTSGSLQNVVLQYYTQTGYSASASAGTSATAGVGGGAGPSSTGSGSNYGMVFMALALVLGGVAVIAYTKKGKKKRHRKGH